MALLGEQQKQSYVWHVALEFKLEDMWLGAFWRRWDNHDFAGNEIAVLEVWVCLLPCLPIHVTRANMKCLE